MRPVSQKVRQKDREIFTSFDKKLVTIVMREGGIRKDEFLSSTRPLRKEPKEDVDTTLDTKR